MYYFVWLQTSCTYDMATWHMDSNDYLELLRIHLIMRIADIEEELLFCHREGLSLKPVITTLLGMFDQAKYHLASVSRISDLLTFGHNTARVIWSPISLYQPVLRFLLSPFRVPF